MAEVEAKLVDDVDAPGTPPGAFEYYNSSDGRTMAGMIYVCPCGCGKHGALAFRPAPAEMHSWQWNGSRTKPTLAPSVHHLVGGKSHWHGHLRKGVWISC